MNAKMLYQLVIKPVTKHVGKSANEGYNQRACVLLVAIAIQESALKFRIQQPRGPARSWWQIEPPTAKDTLHRCKPALEFCTALGVIEKGKIPNEALQYNDLAACTLARGILLLTPGELPTTGQQYEQEAWNYYLKAWRPGKPRLEKWPSAYRQALEIMHADSTE